MPDWVQFIRSHLRLENLRRERADEIVEDLARQLEDCYQEALDRGLPEPEARAHARAQIQDWESLVSDLYRTNRRDRSTVWNDSLTKPLPPAQRSQGGIAAMVTDIKQDLIYGLRLLRRSPVFAAVAVLTLALGIGANTAIFTMLDRMVLRPLPYRDSHELVSIHNTFLPRGWNSINLSYPDLLDYRENAKSFTGLAAFTSRGVNFSGGRGEPIRLQAGLVTSGFFEILGLPPILGRTIRDEDLVLSNERIVLLTEEVWQRQFGGADILGLSILLNGRSYMVVGVVPFIPRLPEIWIPLPPSESVLRRSNRFLGVVGRLKPDVTLAPARVEMEQLARQLEEAYPDTNGDYGIHVTSLKDFLVDREDRAIVFTLFGVVCLVLLIACANVGNLMVARTSTRNKELAVRAALGAGPARLARQILTESVLLGCIGGAVGVLLAYGGVQLLVGSLPPFVPRLDEIRMDIWTLLFTLLVSVLTGILFGLGSSWRALHTRWQDDLKEGGRAAGGSRRQFLRSSLAVLQVAAALVLLVCAGLFLRGILALTQTELGYDSDSILTMEMTLPSVQYSSAEQVAGFYRTLTERLRNLPGVEAAAVTSKLYMGQGTLMRGFIRYGDPIPEDRSPAAVYYVTGPGYLPLMRVPLLAGRDFTPQDNSGGSRVVIVNEKLARETFGEEDPVGKQIHFYFDEDLPRTIIGVVGNTLHGDFDMGILPQAYVPHRQSPWTNMNVILRADTPEAARSFAVAAVHTLDQNLPVYNVRTMNSVIERQAQGLNTLATLLALFSALAVTLAVMGIYGVVSYLVSQRTHEIGVRLALGAGPAAILRLVLRHGLLLALTGVSIGLALAVALSRFLVSQLEFFAPGDFVSYAGLSLLLLLVTLLATYVPARRATRVDPMVALRYE